MERNSIKKNSPIDNFIWVLKEISKFKKRYVLVLLVDAVLKGVMPIITLLLTQKLIDLIQYRSAILQKAVFLLVMLFITQLFSEIILIFTNVKLNNYELDFDRFFQQKIYSKASTLKCKDFENSYTYDLINRAQYDANTGVLGSIKIFFSLTSAIISVVSYSIIILKYNYVLFLIIAIVPVIRYLFEKRFNLKEYILEKENTEPNRKASYISYLLTNSENFKEIKTFGLFDFFIKKYNSIKYNSIKYLCNLKLIRLNNKRGQAFVMLTILEKLVDFAVTILIMIQTFNGVLSIGNFVLYNNSIENLKDSVVSMFSQLSYLYKNSAMLDQIRSFFELSPENTNESGIIIENIVSIKLDHVSYKYQGKKNYALKNINLEIKAGELVIFMGNNGSGKTTLVKIIMGIYDDYSGTVFVNNYDLKTINLNQYRKKVSALFQNYIQYESTIADNIIYGDICKQYSKEYVIDILRKIRLEECADDLSQNLGYQFQEGTQMSIGQWQKLALGRTLYREADIYVFDEPNASLDLKTESAILKTIHDETNNKIAFIIMHRFNYMVEVADQIVVLNNGIIAECGSHEQLIDENGLYYDLFQMYKELNES
ncbi:ABC transporter ATP-binding protein [Eubacterium ramulus]|uniref:ABC transporter ATP-binding protein n=1 Tax=Eubacterium ramulus TaxID=39490 RepID=UPI0022E64325|nr:ABC transporter ATP-binding protein [Eubacterium ramulus]